MDDDHRSCSDDDGEGEKEDEDVDDSDDDVDGDDLHMCHHMFLHMHTLHQTHTWRLHYLSSGCDDDDDDDDGYDDDYHNYDDSEGETKPQRVLPLFQLNQICFSFKHASNQQSSGPKLLVQYILNIFIKIVHFNFDHFLWAEASQWLACGPMLWMGGGLPVIN